MKPIRTLALIVNKLKPGACEFSGSLESIARGVGITVQMTEDYPISGGFLNGADACCALGGDGTLLRTLNESIRSKVPVFGINQGKLGFLATFPKENIEANFRKLVEGQYQIAERNLIDAQMSTGQSIYCLNDLVIKTANNFRLVDLEVFADNERITSYSCDGLIFSTSTGSTAYNLSAGGPIIYPGSGVMVMTPICPHTLSNRALIFANACKLKVYNLEPQSTPLISHDGAILNTKQTPFPITIQLAKETFKLLQLPEYSHFEIIRNKLNWGN